MKVSVAIPIYNRWNLTRACLRSLQNTCRPGAMVARPGPIVSVVAEQPVSAPVEPVEFEFLFVDNGSDDGSADRLREFAREDARIKVGRFEENHGFAIGSNEGLRAATGDVVVFLNNDTEALGFWWAPLVERLTDPSVGAVGALLWYPGRPRTVQHAGMVWVGHVEEGRPLKAVHLYRHRQASHEPGIRRAKRMQMVTGACLAMRTGDARRLGGFCTDYLNSYEDIDLCFRVRFELGLDVWYEPRAELVHHESQTAGRAIRENANEALFLQRWRSRVEVDATRVMNEDRHGAAAPPVG